MAECNELEFELPGLSGRKIEGNFAGGNVSRDGSNIDSAKHAWAILGLLVKALRQRWPEVKITVRADSGFCRWKMLRSCGRTGVNYLVGLAKNERLHALSAKMQKRAERKYQRSGEKVRLFTQL